MATSKEFVDYIVERIGHDVGFLKSQGLLSAIDENAILSRLSNIQITSNNNIASVTSSPVAVAGSPAPPYHADMSRSSVGPLVPTPSPVTVPQSPTFPLKQVRTPSGGSAMSSTPTISADHALLKRAVPPPPQRNTKINDRCRALWDYNLDGAEDNDLSFRKGDVIELVEDERANNDWWFGTIGDQTGLFPSNHVERISSEHPNRFRLNESTIQQSPPAPSYSGGAYGTNAALYEKPRFPGQGQSALSPPPTQAHPSSFAGDGEGLNQHGLHQSQDMEKKEKFKKLKGQVGTAVTTGFGFGAGAAVGSGIVNAIF